MKKIHYHSLRFHTMFTVTLAMVFVATALIVRDLLLGVVLAFLLAYIIGNGIIHGKTNELNRDAMLEYGIVSLIVIALLLGVFLTR
jgi:hypothetical protein